MHVATRNQPFATANRVPSAANKNFLSYLADILCPLLLIAICLAVALPRYRARIDWADEGFLAYGAVRVIEGQIPNHDFVSLQPPLSFYTTAAAFKLLGTSLATMRELGLSIFVLIPLLIYALARNVMKPGLACAAALPSIILGLPYFNFVPFAVWQGIAMTLVAVALYLRALFKTQSWLALFAGILTTLSIFLRHDQGVYLAISFFVLTVAMKCAKGALNPIRIFVFWLVGAAALAFPFAIFCWSQGAIPGMFRQLVLFPLTTYWKTSSAPFPHFDAQLPIQQNALIALFFLPPTIASIAAIWLGQRILRRRFDSVAAMLTFLLAWSAFYYCLVLTRSDVHHLLITLPPFFVLTAFCWRLFLGALGPRKILRISTSIFAAAPVCWFLWMIAPLALPDVTMANETLALDRGGIRIENGKWISDFIRGVQKYVPLDRSILVLPYQPVLYFLCERRNPTHWNYLWPGDQTAQDHVDLIEQARRDPPAVIFITNEGNITYAPAILDYVHQNYDHTADFGQLSIYFPRSPTP